jgi:hypothetical protein
VGAHDGEVGRDLAVRGLYCPQVALAEKRLSVVLKWALTPSSRQDSSTGSMMSGVGHLRHRPRTGVDQCVSIPRCAKAVVISTPRGEASTTTATFTVSRTLSHSMASRMFLT